MFFNFVSRISLLTLSELSKKKRCGPNFALLNKEINLSMPSTARPMASLLHTHVQRGSACDLAPPSVLYWDDHFRYGCDGYLTTGSMRTLLPTTEINELLKPLIQESGFMKLHF